MMNTKIPDEMIEKIELSSQDHDVDLFEANRQAERKLRTKIDFYVVPTVALLYLMCFIDRANIGE